MGIISTLIKRSGSRLSVEVVADARTLEKIAVAAKVPIVVGNKPTEKTHVNLPEKKLPILSLFKKEE